MKTLILFFIIIFMQSGETIFSNNIAETQFQKIVKTAASMNIEVKKSGVFTILFYGDYEWRKDSILFHQLSQKNLSIPEILKVIQNQYKLLLGSELSDDGFSDFLCKQQDGPHYGISIFKKYLGYRYRYPSFTSLSDKCGRGINYKISGIFVSPTGKVNIFSDEALPLCLNAVKEKYLNVPYDVPVISDNSFIQSLYSDFSHTAGLLLHPRKILTADYTGIYVVAPSNLFQNGVCRVHDFSFGDSCTSLRLAHEFVVGVDEKPYAMKFRIWIDTENGEFIGGESEFMSDIEEFPPDEYKLMRDRYTRFSYDEETKEWVEKPLEYHPWKTVFVSDELKK